jgi:hypothetical protein
MEKLRNVIRWHKLSILTFLENWEQYSYVNLRAFHIVLSMKSRRLTMGWDGTETKSTQNFGTEIAWKWGTKCKPVLMETGCKGRRRMALAQDRVQLPVLILNILTINVLLLRVTIRNLLGNDRLWQHVSVMIKSNDIHDLRGNRNTKYHTLTAHFCWSRMIHENTPETDFCIRKICRTRNTAAVSS